jgi:uncharacterized membrane protein
MDASHIHLLLNHFPILGTLIASGILLWGIYQKNHAIKMLATALLVVMAVIAIPVYLTGEPAEEKIEHLSDFVESTVELHEDAALVALIIMELTGAVALGVFIIGIRRGVGSNTGFLLVLGLSLVTSIAMARVGYLGGPIRHTELRGDISPKAQVYELQDNRADTSKSNATKEQEEHERK